MQNKKNIISILNALTVPKKSEFQEGMERLKLNVLSVTRNLLEKVNH